MAENMADNPSLVAEPVDENRYRLMSFGYEIGHMVWEGITRGWEVHSHQGKIGSFLDLTNALDAVQMCGLLMAAGRRGETVRFQVEIAPVIMPVPHETEYDLFIFKDDVKIFPLNPTHSPRCDSLDALSDTLRDVFEESLNSLES